MSGERPLCQDCGHRHWPKWEPHVWSKAPVTRKAPSITDTAPAPQKRKASFDRLAYQRAYMRAWRANRKALKDKENE